MIVYRCFNEQFGLMALQQTQWKIGRLLELNDPLDCQPTLIRKGEALLAEDSPFIRDTYEWLGILCYSAQIDDPVIWSHYAECHRGIALGFELPPGELFKVEYPADHARAQLDYDKLEELVTVEHGHALMELIARGFTRKANGWKVRGGVSTVYLPARMRNDWTALFPRYASTTPKRIVLGVNSRLPSQIFFASSASGPEVILSRIAKAKIDELSYKLKIETQG